MSEPVFTAKALTKTYASGEVMVHALNNVDLEIAAKEVVVLLGPSGSGKTTLLNIMGGLDRATSGRLFFRDLDLTDLGDRELTKYRRDHIGFVFQFYNLVPSLTAYENVALVTEIAGDPMRPEEALALVGLEERMHHFPAQLSGGEQQRVAIARALVAEPALVLVDEPTGNLDSRAGGEIASLLRQVASDWGRSVLMATHAPRIAAHADRIIFLKDGTIVDETKLKGNEADEAKRVREKMEAL